MIQGERKIIVDLRTRAEHSLKTCVLSFWIRYMTDQVYGEFYGRVDGNLRPDLSSPESMVLNGRMLWTYNRAWDMVQYPACQGLTQRTFRYIQSHFWDELYGGIYWVVTCRGKPSGLEKHTYAQAFLIYSYVEYYRIFGSKKALDWARQVLSLLNRHMEYLQGGYVDSTTRDWLRDDWVNFWVENRTGAVKLFNSNMHLFEAIYNLAQAAPEPWILRNLQDELEFLLGTIMNRKLHHLKAVMDVSGARLDHEINYERDAECSYLLTSTAELLGNADLIRKTRGTVVDLMDHVLAEGMDPEYGGLYYIGDNANGEINRAEIWWVQAEGTTASFNCYQSTGDRRYLGAVVDIWNYVERYMVNHDLGEWYSVGLPPYGGAELKTQADRLKEAFNNNELTGEGKCPYHNSGTCFEIMHRAGVILSPAGACPWELYRSVYYGAPHSKVEIERMMETKSALKEALSLALSLALTISLAACSSSGNITPSTDPAASGGSAGSGDLSRVHLKMGGQIRQTSLHLYYARDTGLFKDTGLGVEVVTLASDPAINEVITAGELDIACFGMASVYVLGTSRFIYVLDTTINSGGQSMYARAGSNIVKASNYNGTSLTSSPDIMKGATMIGLFVSTAQYSVITYAKAMNLTTEDVNLMNMDHAQGYQAFVSGEGDILSATPPYSSMPDADSNYVMVADMSDLMNGTPLVDSLVVTNEPDENYHDVVVAFAECCFEAMDQSAKDDELQVKYATNLYLNEGDVTYDEEDMAAEIANVTYWTWGELGNPSFEPGTTMRAVAQFFIDQGQVGAGSLSSITDSLKYEIYRTEILDCHNSY